jgi:ABC-type transporter Mla subunit MlaD
MSAATTRYFKLGLFVLGAVVLFIAITLIVGSGNFGRSRTKMETYFNESVQGLDIGSKVKYRGVSVGEVTLISFTNTRYEQDKHPTERKQYVMVETGLDSKLVSGRLGDVGQRDGAFQQQIERGLRVRLNPQGITGTSYLEIDFLDPTTNKPLAIDWHPSNLYIPSAPSTVKQFVDAASDLLNELRRADLANLGLVFRETVASFNQLATTANARIEKIPTEQLSQDVANLLGELRASNRRLDQTIAKFPVDKLSGELTGLVTELRDSNQRLAKVLADPAMTRLPEQTAAMVSTTTGAFERMRNFLDNPELGRSVAQLQRTVGRLERILVGREGDIATTLENLRLISDNLRDTTESAKHYPSQLLLGEPPPRARSAP